MQILRQHASATSVYDHCGPRMAAGQRLRCSCTSVTSNSVRRTGHALLDVTGRQLPSKLVTAASEHRSEVFIGNLGRQPTVLGSAIDLGLGYMGRLQAGQHPLKLQCQDVHRSQLNQVGWSTLSQLLGEMPQIKMGRHQKCRRNTWHCNNWRGLLEC